LGSLTTLEIEAGDWRIDLSRFVMNLPLAFPHRILVSTELEDDGRFHELVLDLPYREHALGSCMVLELLITEGRVLDTTAVEAGGKHCPQ
jgi:hypothetical protein